MDTGSTISAVTPSVADKLMNQLKINSNKSRAFLVENGGNEDVTFCGNYLEIECMKPSSIHKEMIKIKFYVMPHDDCSYEMIIGFDDLKRLGYKITLMMEDGQVIYKHRGKPDKYTFADKACDIYERLAQLPPYGDVFKKLETQTNKKLKIKIIQ